MNTSIHLLSIAGTIMMVISLLNVAAILFAAMKGTALDSSSKSLLRVMMLVGIVLFVLDYLTGAYESNYAALEAFTGKMGLAAATGIIIITLAAIMLIVSKFLSKATKPDVKTFRTCFFRGLILAAVAFVLRWLMTGST